MPKRSAVDTIEIVRNGLASLLVLAFIGALTTFTFFVIPAANKDILTYMVGQLSGMALMALGFYFTNKVGQDALDKARAENTGKLAEAVTTAVKSSASGDAAGAAADEVATAATDKAEEIKS